MELSESAFRWTDRDCVADYAAGADGELYLLLLASCVQRYAADFAYKHCGPPGFVCLLETGERESK